VLEVVNIEVCQSGGSCKRSFRALHGGWDSTCHSVLLADRRCSRSCRVMLFCSFILPLYCDWSPNDHWYRGRI